MQWLMGDPPLLHWQMILELFNENPTRQIQVTYYPHISPPPCLEWSPPFSCACEHCTCVLSCCWSVPSQRCAGNKSPEAQRIHAERTRESCLQHIAPGVQLSSPLCEVSKHGRQRHSMGLSKHNGRNVLEMSHFKQVARNTILVWETCGLSALK